MALELEALAGLGGLERWLELRPYDRHRRGIEILQEVVLRPRLRLAEQPVVQPDRRRIGALGAHPVDVAFDLVLVRRRCTGARVRVISAAHDTVVHAYALHHVPEPEAHLVAGE